MNEIEHEGILAIFLAEAEEIVQRLSEQLTELRYGYDGQRILDDIHRGFHTLYGGATVLKLDELAECTQLAERVMERVRTRRVSMTPSLVSLFVATLGATELMLARRINHQEPRVIDSELKSRLLRAADGNNSPTAANNPVESAGDPMSVFFDGRLRPRDKPLTDLAPSVLQYESASYVPSALQAASEPAASVASEGAALDTFQNYSKSNFETLDAVISAPLRQSQTETQSVTAAEAASNLDNLVGELSWVRQRLMKFRGKGHSAELDKALVYLDLVTQDFERLNQQNDKNS